MKKFILDVSETFDSDESKPLRFLAHWHSINGGLCLELSMALANRWPSSHAVSRSFAFPARDSVTLLRPAWTTPRCEARVCRYFVVSYIEEGKPLKLKIRFFLFSDLLLDKLFVVGRLYQ